MRKFLVTAFFVSHVLSQRSEAIVDISVLAALNSASPSIQTAGTPATVATNAKFGFGALIAFPIFPAFDLETGALYLSHSYTSGGFQNTIDGIQVPALLRFTGFPILSVAAGPYLSFPTGNFVSRNVGTGAETGTPHASSSIPAMDIGVALSVAADIPLNDAVMVVADVRYYFGLKSVDSNPINSFKYGGLLILAGLKLGL